MLPLVIVGFAMMTLGVALLLIGETPFLGGKRIPAMRSRLIGAILVGFLPLAWGVNTATSMLFGEVIAGTVIAWCLFVVCWIVIGVILFRVLVPKRATRGKIHKKALHEAIVKQNPFAESVEESSPTDPATDDPTPAPAPTKKPAAAKKVTKPPVEEKNPFDFS